MEKSKNINSKQGLEYKITPEINGLYVRTIFYLNELVKYKSYSNEEKQIVDYIENVIKKVLKKDNVGFKVEVKRIDNKLLIDLNFSNDEYICLVGHVDIVKEGDISKWNSDPFKLTTVKSYNLDEYKKLVTEDRIEDIARKNIESIYIGRGVSDMKGFVAIMLALIEEFKYKKPKYNIRLVFYDKEEEAERTGIEELLDENSDKKIRDFFKNNKFIIIGEPTSLDVHYGVYGYVGGYMNINGKGGHSSKINILNSVYNKFIKLGNYLIELQKRYQNDLIIALTSINGEEVSLNSIPSYLKVGINLRYNPRKINQNVIQGIVKNLIKEYNFKKVQNARGFVSNLETVKQFFDSELLDDFKAAYKVASYWSDLAVIGNELNFSNVVNWGPGRIEEAHKINEKLYGKDLYIYLCYLYKLLF